MPTLFVIDDEAGILHAFKRAFPPPEFAVETAATAADALARLPGVTADVIVLDVHLPDGRGLATFHKIKAADGRTPVVLITGHGTSDLAIEAIKHGAFDYLTKPLELAQLRAVITQAVKTSRLMSVPAVMPEVEPAPAEADALLGRCPAMQDVYKAIGRVAATDATALILGESGTGKELVARAVYQHSKRSRLPFLAINCAAIPEALLESELFGHERGAFTGADRKRIGKFEQCSGGTIFLDEVGDMTPLLQAKVLRLLQEQTFERVGGTETITTDVRLIAATNVDLDRAVEGGKFRRDLYFRLNVFSITLPPLRDRGDDIDLLIEYYLRRCGRELDKPVGRVEPAATELLRAYAWPGNVRELQSVLQQAVLTSRGGVLTAADLPGVVAGRAAPPAGGGAFDWGEFVRDRVSSGSTDLYAEALGLMEREVLMGVLQHTGGNQVQSARILGITRGSLRHKIRALNISIGRAVWSDDDQGE